MDPNLFHLDWERTFEALVGVIVLSFLIERAMAILFESRWWIGRYEDERVARKKTPPASGAQDDAGKPEDTTKSKEAANYAKAAAQQSQGKTPPANNALAAQRYPVKEMFTFLVALAVCWHWDFDAVSIILLSASTSKVGVAVTAAVIAGGSKASIKLFQDVFNIRSSAVQEKKTLSEAKQ